MMYGNYGYNYGLTNFLGGGILTIVFGILLIILIVWLVREVSGRHRHIEYREEHHNVQNSSNTALDILKERFARGELTKEEFEEKKRIIS